MRFMQGFGPCVGADSIRRVFAWVMNKVNGGSSTDMNGLIVQLLASEKLNGDNYAAWKLYLNTILVVDDLRFVLTEECPQTPASNANRTSRKVYDRWIKASEKAHVYILASMSDVLAKKHESLATTKKIIDSLKGMFGQQEWSVRHETIKYIYTKRMKEETSIREHVLDMMMHLNIAEVNGGAIDEANQENSSWKKLSEGEVTLKVGTGEMVSAKAVGDLKLFFDDRYIMLKNVLTKRLVKSGLLSQLEDNSLPPCDSCLEGKMTKRSFTGKGKTIKTLRSDRGGEYMDLQFQDYLIEHGIQSQLSAPSMPQQNGGYALETTIYILNNVPSKSVSETPYELRKGRKGYPKESKGGLFYDPQENKVFVSINATFLQEDHIRNHQTCSKLVLEEISKNTTDRPSSSTKVVDKTRDIGQTHLSQELGEPRRSGRVVRQPDRYLGLSEAQIVIPDNGIKDPLTYKQTMNDVDCDQWVKAMDLEIESMYSNSV
ncbi:gag/pol protein [Cucumis melo var. makuwa]|uniref:Gag/pol protein n=1 Tax=Cucumis melo var. makuwa TaxID=1194695 RepID=A0A5D3E3F1_CUCMM|nr:gag/pol protein [Cucumis melo var. makuwa]TYK30416.1 gag/pol protein [Cucumis melo var. makuwa]